MWDVFISHAWEDKDTAARPLADALSKSGLSVWYDEFTLTLGDSLRRSIDRGLAESRYGVVILSPHFFAKSWPQRELDGLTAREISTGKVILPVWHNVTREDIERFSPPLADKLGISTSTGLDSVVREILRAIHPESRHDSPGVIPDLDSKFAPITHHKAREMLGSAPKGLLDELEEIFFMFDVQNYDGWVKDAQNLLYSIERYFGDPVIIARSEGEVIIRKAKKANSSFDHTKHPSYNVGYGLVTDIVMSINPHILSKGECIDKFFEYPDRVVVPFLIAKYYSDKVASPTYEDIQSMLFDRGFGMQILPIIEKNIAYGPPSIQWRNAVNRAEGILGNKFAAWYRGIRGISYEEDVKQYSKREARRSM